MMKRCLCLGALSDVCSESVRATQRIITLYSQITADQHSCEEIKIFLVLFLFFKLSVCRVFTLNCSVKTVRFPEHTQMKKLQKNCVWANKPDTVWLQHKDAPVLPNSCLNFYTTGEKKLFNMLVWKQLSDFFFFLVLSFLGGKSLIKNL